MPNSPPSSSPALKGPSGLLIREVRPGDAAAVAHLCRELGYDTDEARARERLARLATQPEHRVLVADRGGRVVGLASLLRAWTIYSDAVSVRLSALVVDSACRGEGIGAVLLAECEEWARAQGAVKLHLTSGAHRAEAHRFYEGRGYAHDGARFTKTL